MKLGREVTSCDADAVSDGARVVFGPHGGAWLFENIEILWGDMPKMRWWMGARNIQGSEARKGSLGGLVVSWNLGICTGIGAFLSGAHVGIMRLVTFVMDCVCRFNIVMILNGDLGWLRGMWKILKLASPAFHLKGGA
jgi:hypothetical protein